jgi:hypothetical protein
MAAIRQRKSRWQARVTRRGFTPETRTFVLKEAAARWGETFETEMDRGGFASRSEAERTLFADVLRRYADEVSPTKRGGKNKVIRLILHPRTRIVSVGPMLLQRSDMLNGIISIRNSMRTSSRSTPAVIPHETAIRLRATIEHRSNALPRSKSEDSKELRTSTPFLI